MNPSTQINIAESINWDALLQLPTLTHQDYAELAGIIVGGMIHRIRDTQTAADGRPLSQNSKWWTSQKLREGRSTNSLMYTRQLSMAQTYNLRFEGESCYIELIPSYLEIHLNLNEISDKMGKNYKDWFGASEDDMVKVIAEFGEIMKRKFEELK